MSSINSSTNLLIFLGPMTLWRPSYTPSSMVIVNFFCIVETSIMVHVFYTCTMLLSRGLNGRVKREHNAQAELRALWIFYRAAVSFSLLLGLCPFRMNRPKLLLDSLT